MEAVVDLQYPQVFPNGGVSTTAAFEKTTLGAPAVSAMDGGETGVYVYRECLKNHAASLGGHALDGCGEFMPSPEADPAHPSSLRCAACGCHRNFHRRLAELPPPPPLLALPPPPPPMAPAAASHVMRDSRTMRGEEAPDDRLPSAFDEETEESDEGSDFDEDRPMAPLQAPAPGMVPPGYHNQGLMPAAPGTVVPHGAAAAAARKRFRTKFSPEQKQRMQALSERLGWRLQKRDDAVVDECCQEIGVAKNVFKVWMHNNKHNFVAGHSVRRSASAMATAAYLSPHAAAPAAAVHSFVTAPAAPPPPPPAHADFNTNGAAAD